ncbi:MAG TPA: mononuclear molybdenum enzyme YedY, partial [Polyangia bacterium]
MTPPSMYFNRRTLMRGGLLVASVVGTSWLYRRMNTMSFTEKKTKKLSGLVGASKDSDSAGPSIVDEPKTSFAAITHYNNFYEFTTDKDRVAERSAGFVTKDWQVAVDGLVHRPGVFDLQDILRLSPPEERVYRM